MRLDAAAMVRLFVFFKFNLIQFIFTCYSTNTHTQNFTLYSPSAQK